MYSFLNWTFKRIICLILEPIVTYKNFLKPKPSFIYGKPINSVNFDSVRKFKYNNNGYVKKFILSKREIKLIINEVKSGKHHKKFEKFNISNPHINFISIYETSSLNMEDKKKSIYANFWHTDDTLYPSCVKIFQLGEKISDDHGPMEFIDRENTKINWVKFFFRGNILKYNKGIKKFKSPSSSLFLDTRSCLHRAGIPKKNNTRKMLMIQVINKKGPEDIDKIFSIQGFTEPTLLK